MVVTNPGIGCSDPKKTGNIDDEIHMIIAAEVAATMMEAVPQMFGSVKTTMIELFDELYDSVTEVVVVVAVAATRLHGGDSM